MAGLEIAKEIGEKIVKDGLKTAVDKLKEGVNPKEALKEGWETIKESSFKELDKFLSPESAEKLESLGKEVDKIQDSIELSSPETFAEIKPKTVEDTNNAVENAKEIEKELKDIPKETMTGEIKEALNDFKEILDQLKEIQEKLIDLGINDADLLSLNFGLSDLLSLQAEALDPLEEEEALDQEEGEGE